jgi:hypothetical protein
MPGQVCERQLGDGKDHGEDEDDTKEQRLSFPQKREEGACDGHPVVEKIKGLDRHDRQKPAEQQKQAGKAEPDAQPTVQVCRHP